MTNPQNAEHNAQFGALTGTRVLELGGGDAAAYGARVLGDFGAQVTKLESASANAPEVLESEAGAALLSTYLNWNKSILDDAADMSESEFEAFVGDFNIVIYGDNLDAIGKWPVGPQELHTKFPGLTVVAITPFGMTGPMANWPASELIVEAMSGLLAISGTQTKVPLKRGLRQSVYATGLNAAYSALASYFGTLNGQPGALIDLSQREVVTSELVLNLPYYSHIGALQGRLPESRDMFFTGTPVEASDGMVSMQINNRIGVGTYADLISEPALADERFTTNEGRLANADEITALVEGALAKWNCRDFFERAAHEGLLTGFVQTADNLLSCPQLNAREFWTRVEIEGTTYLLPGRLAALSSTPMGSDSVTLQGANNHKESSHV